MEAVKHISGICKKRDKGVKRIKVPDTMALAKRRTGPRLFGKYSEKKAVDFYGIFHLSNDKFFYLMNRIPQGVGNQARVGSKVFITGYQVRVSWEPMIVSLSPSVYEPQRVAFAIVYSDAAAEAWEGTTPYVYWDPTIPSNGALSYPDPQFQPHFKTLDKGSFVTPRLS